MHSLLSLQTIATFCYKCLLYVAINDYKMTYQIETIRKLMEVSIYFILMQ